MIHTYSVYNQINSSAFSRSCTNQRVRSLNGIPEFLQECLTTALHSLSVPPYIETMFRQIVVELLDEWLIIGTRLLDENFCHLIPFNWFVKGDCDGCFFWLMPSLKSVGLFPKSSTSMFQGTLDHGLKVRLKKCGRKQNRNYWLMAD